MLLRIVSRGKNPRTIFVSYGYKIVALANSIKIRIEGEGKSLHYNTYAAIFLLHLFGIEPLTSSFKLYAPKQFTHRSKIMEGAIYLYSTLHLTSRLF
jgi:hypothetical protein